MTYPELEWRDIALRHRIRIWLPDGGIVIGTCAGFEIEGILKGRRMVAKRDAVMLLHVAGRRTRWTRERIQEARVELLGIAPEPPAADSVPGPDQGGDAP